MRLYEFIHPTATILTEGDSQVSKKDWLQSSSTPDFMDRLLSGEDIVLTIRRDKKVADGKNAKGKTKYKIIKGAGQEVTFKIDPRNKVDPNTKVAYQLSNAIEEDDINSTISGLSFSGVLCDEEGNATDTVVDIPVRDIIKDENFSGKLRVNLGNMAEIALGCAVTARFKKQQGNIEHKDFLAVATELIQSDAGMVEASAGKDTVTFRITVPSSDKKAFIAYLKLDPRGKSLENYGVAKDTIKGIDTHILNAIEYANTSTRVASAIKTAATDYPDENVIDIVSDGGNAEEQKSTKADLKILVDGRSINLLSIKAGNVGQFGQVSGWEFERLNEFFEKTFDISLSQNVSKAFVHKRVKDPDNESLEDEIEDTEAMRLQNYQKGFKVAYAEIYKTLNSLAEKNQIELIERVYNGLYYHATRQDPQVEMVILSPNSKTAFHELTFGPELRETLDDYNFSTSVGKSDSGMHIIEINGNLLNDTLTESRGKTQLLIKVRSYAQASTVRNIVEMGPLLKHIADREEIEIRKQKKEKDSQSPVKDKPVGQEPTVDTQVPEPVADAPLVPGPNAAEPSGTPSGMNNIAPATQQEMDPENSYSTRDELDRVKKNAGISVE
jgi:hypothetical protein